MTNYHAFTISQADATKTLIEGQHGDFSKGIVELVMNAVDGKASKCEITIGKGAFTVKDNGCGFGVGDKAVSRFKELGSRHSEREGATFGRFGLGRTQVLPWGKIHWTSGHHKFSTDYRDHQGFHITELRESFDGCLVGGELYPDRRLASYELQRALSEITDYLQFLSGIEIVLNGAVINNRKMVWDIETEQVKIKWIDLNTAGYHFQREVKIYNQGVLVQALNQYPFQAMVVTKKAIKVNMARNAPDKSCPVWQEVEDVLSTKDRELRYQRKRRGMTKGLRDDIYAITTIGLDAESTRELLQLELNVSLKRLVQEPFLCDIRGRFHAIRDLKKPITLTPHGREREAEQLSILGTVVPITISELHFWQASDIESLSKQLVEFDLRLVNLLCDIDSRYSSVLKRSELKQHETIPFEDAIRQIDSRNILLPNKDLTQAQAAARNALQYAANSIAKRLSKVQGVDIPKRSIRIGQSYSAAGWTDAATFIAVESKQLKYLDQGLSGAVYMSLLLLHEYTHNKDFPESDTHGELFYECFHEAVLTPGQREIIGNTAGGLKNRYLSELLKKNLRVPEPLKGMKYELEVEEFTLNCRAKDLSDFALWLINTLGITILGGRKSVTLTITSEKRRQGQERLRNAIQTQLPRKLLMETLNERMGTGRVIESIKEELMQRDNAWREMMPELVCQAKDQLGWDADAFHSFLLRQETRVRYQRPVDFMCIVMDAIVKDSSSKATSYEAPSRSLLPEYKVGNAQFSAKLPYWEYRGIGSSTEQGLVISAENLLEDSRVRLAWVANGVNALIESIHDKEERDEVRAYLRENVLKV